MPLADRARRHGRLALAAVVALASLPIVLGFPSGTASAGPPPVFTMYVPFTEQQISDGLFSILTSPSWSPTDVTTQITITSAADNSILYWDHWEDDYEADIANAPGASTTETWGDMDLSNGAAPGVTIAADDVINAGTVITLENSVVLPRDPATFFFDGRDKVASTRGFAMTRAGWDTTLGTVHAGAVATTDLSKYGTQFDIPIGENIYSNEAFQYTALTVMASDDNTVVEIDRDGDGTVDETHPLNEGETAYVDGGINAGAFVEATKPVQVHLLTGDVDSLVASRWYEVFPEEVLGDEYVAAASTTIAAEPVSVFLHNPSDTTTIDIAVDAQGTADDTILTVVPGGTVPYTLPAGSGAQFSSPGNNFSAVSATVSLFGTTRTYDWGYTLVPTSALTPGVVVGWAAGSPTGDPDYSPVWVAPLADTDLDVDYDGDGTVDTTITGVTQYESVTISDPDGDLTGARISSPTGVLLSVAWGQDPNTADPADAYDLGTAVLPTTSLVTTKSSRIVVDLNSDGLVNPGDTLEYTIRSVDAGALALTNVNVVDQLPATLTYVPNSTTVDAVPIADDTVGTPFPVDEGGVTIPVLAAGQAVEVTFLSTLVDPFPIFTQTVRNNVAVTSDQANSTATSIVPVVIPDLYIAKTSNAPGPLLPGQTFSYDIDVANIDVSAQTGIDVTDVLPPEVTWVSTSVTRPIDDPAPGGSAIIADDFDTVAYDNYSADWVTDWIETDPAGGGASGGDVQILNELGDNRLRMQGGSREIERTFDGTDWGEAYLTFETRRESFDNADDWVKLEISETAGTSWIELDRIVGPGTDIAYVPAFYDLTRYLGQEIVLRWVTSPSLSATDDEFFFDNVAVAVNRRITEVVPGAAPPSVYSGGELLTGESLTVTVTVTVDPAIDPTTDFITNNSSAVSIQNTSPVTSQATDPIARASVGDTVWHDLDGDGVVDGGEPRLAGVTVTLYDDVGGFLASAVTDAAGNYSFTDLDPADYTVAVTAGVPGAMAATFDDDGGYDSSTDLTLGFDEDNTTTNFGYAVPVDLGDRVFGDVDGNGVENGTDFGIDGLTVTLTGPSHPGGTTDVTSSGTYGFTNLLPGTYTVVVDTSPLSTASYSTTGGDSQVVALTSGNDDFDVDFGYVLPAAIGDLVFHDLNADGDQDPGEPGFVGVDVRIDGPGLPVGGLTTTTDATGYYLFSNLDAGDFTITVLEGTGDLPAGYDASTPGGLVQTRTVTDDEIVDDVDFGFYTQATIGDLLFDDSNGNGVWDGGESGIDGVPIVITGPSFPLGTTVTTAGGGAYDVTVDPGTYTVVPDTSGFPVGTVNTLDGASPSVTVASTDDVDTADFGYVFPAFIGDLVFHDLDNSGGWDPGEPGLGGVDLTLTGGPLPPGGVTTTTAADGSYLFSGIAPGLYAVNVDTATVPPGYVVSTGGDGIGGILVVSGSSLLGFDFGYRTTADIGDLIFHDLNASGSWDAGEPGLPGVDVTLTGPGVPPGTTDTTDAAGNYLFADLDPGAYTVTVDTATVPAGYTVTAGTDSRSTTLVSDADDLTLDLGYATTASIGDFVWDDLDGDGVFDAGEPGFDGVTVTLDDGVSPITQDTVNGAYDFAGLSPGTYTVSVDLGGLPPGVVNTLGGGSRIVTVVSAEDENDADFAYYLPASIGDLVWDDLDGDGVFDAGEPGFPGVTVTLTGATLPPGGITDVTDAAGAYDFASLAPGTYTATLTLTDLPPGAVNTFGGSSQVVSVQSGEVDNDVDFGFYVPAGVGDLVWDDLNGNGTRDPGEPGIAGVTLTLTGPGVPPGTTDDTDGAGDYGFGGLAPGLHTVTVDTADLLAGATSTTGGFVDSTTLVSGTGDLTLDFGVANPITIGDTVFDDLDGNGLPDPGEPGLAGVDVTITGPSHPGGTTVATDGSGNYSFTGLLPGSYTVDVDVSDVPPGYTNSSPTSVTATYVSGDDVDTVDFGFIAPADLGDFVFEDLDADGAFDAGEPGLAGVTLELTGPGVPPGTTVVTTGTGAYNFGGLAPGTYTVTITGVPAGYTNTLGGPSQVTTLSSGETDGSLDFGFYLGASIGDFVFEDLNGNGSFDAGEPGFDGVTITLDDGVSPITQDTVNGTYDFVGLTPGTYTVTVELGDLPAGVVNTLGGASQVFSVVSGDDEDGGDFAYYVPGSIGDYVWDDLDGDGVQDDGPPATVGLAGVDVTITGPSFPGGTTVTTDATGAYDVTGLAPGSYSVVVGPGGLPAGATSTTGGFTVAAVPITSGDDVDTVDFGVAIPASLGDLLYADNNGNAVFDAGDAPLPGVTMTLTGPGVPPGTTDVTDGGGNYDFSGLLPGDFTVTVDTAGLAPGSFSTTGGDAQLVTLTSGQSDDTVDFGYAEPASIGDTLFHDLDNSGVQDPGEPGIADVDITIIGPSHPLGFTIPTGPTGGYAFTGLAPGLYGITVETADPDLDPAYVSTTGGDGQIATVASGEVVTTVDFGYTAPGSIGDLVFVDSDADGSQAGESGLGGVTLALTGGALPPSGISTTTDPSGAYSFPNVLPGNYTVTVTGGLPPGAFSTTGGTAQSLTITSGEDDDTIDFGFAQPATIGDFVFDDLDGDAVVDGGEPGFAAVDVTITGPSHPGGFTVATDGSGGYSFGLLTPGTYTITVDTGDLPAGAVNTLGGPSRVVTVESDETVLTADFGYYRPATIGDLVFEDLDGDGSFDVGEPGLGSVDVTITGPSHPGGFTIQTDAAGAYDFTGLAPGLYDVAVTGGLPAGAVNTLGGASQSFTVGSGDDEDDGDFGYYEPSTLGDYIWDDLNGDGVQNDGPASAVGIGGVDVTITGPSFPAGTTVATDPDGGYDLGGLAPGSYTVDVPLTGPLSGGTSTTGGTTQVFVITSGTDEDGADFGVAFPAAIGDTVFDDANGDGIEDPGDTGFAAVDVTIVGPSHPVGTTVATDGSGTYNFGNLLPGSYTVTVDPLGLPAGSISTTGGDVRIVVVQSGETDDGVDFGYAQPAAIGDQLFVDNNGNGAFDAGDTGIADVDVTITGPGLGAGATVTTGPTGTYGITGLEPGTFTVTVDTSDPDFDAAWASTTGGDSQVVPISSGDDVDTVDFGYAAPASVGDTLFDDLNGDGTQQPGEPGIAGITVTLTGGDLGGPVTTTTSATGTYGFAGLTPGDYVVAASVPGFASTTGGPSRNVSLVSGETDDTIDFGFAAPASLGDTVFHDLNGDGTQGPGEPGLAGVTVTLTGPGVPPGTTDVTDASGGYGFAGLSPGSHTVTIDTAGLPSPSYASTTGGDSRIVVLASGDADLDVDFGYAAPASIGDLVWDDLDGDGLWDAGEPGFDGVTVTLDDGVSPITQTTVFGVYSFTGLAPGTYTISVDTADLPAGVVNTFGGADQTVTVESTEVLDSVDFGYYRPGSIGDLVFVDGNGNGTFNLAESGLDGVEVTLTGAPLGAPLVTTTALGGGYLFTGLAPGTYTVTLTAGIPAGATSTTGGNATTVTIVSGEDRLDVDFGLAQNVTVGDLVWHDLDGDGTDDAGEPGIAGVVLELRDITNLTIDTATTDGAGAYQFGNVAPGLYTVVVDTATVPAGYTASTAESVPISVTSGNDIVTVDVGYTTTGSIGDLVWDDLDGDGVRDPGEPGLDGVTVTLTGGDLGGPISTVTAGGGAYGFAGLDPGTYTATVTPPAGASVTTGGDASTVTIASDEDRTDVDFGYAFAASIGDRIWHDLDGDGVQDGGELGIAGVEVTLTGPSGPASATTDGLGNYVFPNLVPGAYTVTYNPSTIPVGAVSGAQYAPTTAGSVNVTIQSGDDDTSADVGFATTGTISGTIYEDDDGDGLEDVGENGLATVTIELVDGGGTVVATTMTDGAGDYTFAGVAPGSYTVRVDESTIPPGFGRTSPASIPVSLVSDQAVTDVDVGYARPATIGDLVWHDVDADGARDGGEPGLPGIAVELVDGGGTVVATETTDASGAYSFTGVDPGTYTVRVDAATLPVGVNSGASYVASSGVPSSVSVTVQSGETVDSADFAFHTTASIGDFVWHDLNADGAQDPGEPGLAYTIELVDGGGTVVATTVALADGSYAFTGVTPGTYEVRVTDEDGSYSSTTGNDPSTVVVVSDEVNDDVDFGFAALIGGSIGNEIWLDLDGDAVRDGGEAGIGGVTVELFLGGVSVDTRVTAATGAYVFVNLAPGSYEVRVDPATLPAGYTATTAGTDGGNTQASTILSGQADLDRDFGYSAPATVGDLVWHDLDGDGIRAVGEPALSGVVLELRDGSGVVVASATTDALGAYTLSAPGPGDYTVTVDPASTPVGINSGVSMTATTATSFAVTLVSNEVRTDLDVGYVTTAELGDTIFDDLDGDGVQDPGEPELVGVTVVLTDGGGSTATAVTSVDGLYGFAGLAPGTYSVGVDASTLPAGSTPTTTSAPVTVTLASDEVDDTIDLGFALPASLEGVVFTDDAGDGSRLGDTGVAGVMVELLDGGGTVVATMMTLPDGSYQFTGLMPGDYAVRPALPAGFDFTIPNSGDDTFDSDVLPTIGETAMVPVTSGDTVTDVDAGILAPATIGDTVWVDLDGDGVQDPDEPGLSGVTVEVRDSGGALVATATTDLDGNYSVSVGPGLYTVSITAPGGYRVEPGGDQLTVTVGSGDIELDVDFGVLGAGSIAGDVIYDVAGDGAIDPSDPGHAGVTVAAVWVGPDGTPGTADDVTFTTTTSGGSYFFGDLPPGAYTVTVDPATLPDGLIDATVDPDGVVDLTTEVVVAGVPLGDVDFASTGTASLGDHVFLDDDEDGVLDPDEAGVGGVVVIATVTTTSGVLTFTTVTDESGYYQFTDLPAGDYVVTLDPTTVPVGLVPSIYTRSATLVINGADDSLDLALVARPGPTAVDDREETPQNTPVVIPVVDNDRVVDGTTVTVTTTTQPPNGSVVIDDDGTVTYTPDAGFTGTDVFDYTICDLDGLAEFGDNPATRLVFCSVATVTVVTPPPDPSPPGNQSTTPTPAATPATPAASATPATPATPASPPPSATTTGTIPRTGTTTGPMQAIALVFLAAGLLLLVGSRRRPSREL